MSGETVYVVDSNNHRVQAFDLEGRFLSSFGEDALGNLYIVDLGGEVFKIVPEPTTLLVLSLAGPLLLRRRRTT